MLLIMKRKEEELMKRLATPNRLIAIILFFFSIGYVYIAFQIPAFTLRTPMDSDVFPKVLGIVMLFLAILLFFERDKEVEVDDEEIKNVKGEIETGVHVNVEEETVTKKIQKKQVFFTILGIALYIFMFEIMGFILSSVLFVICTTYYFGYRKHLINVVVAVTVIMILYLGLTKGMNIHLPKGWVPFI
jgi:putative tricarboxylic transport membrane protein